MPQNIGDDNRLEKRELRDTRNGHSDLVRRDLASFVAGMRQAVG